MRRGPAVVLVTLVFALTIAALWVIDPFGWQPPSASPPAETVVEKPSADPITDAERAAAALVALTDDPAAGAAADTRPTVDPAVALPPGSKLVPDQSTWGPDGIGGGSMDVVLSVPGQADTRFVAVMVEEDGAWKVLGTLEQTEMTAAP